VNRPLVVALLLGLVAACDPNASPNVAPSNTPQVVKTAAAVESPWDFSTESDEMTGKKVETACVTSENTITLGFPYGETGARLCLRNHPRYGHDAFVTLTSTGQILCVSYDGEGCSVKVRFDEGSPQSYHGTEPSDNSSTSVFLSGRSSLETSLRKAKIARVELSFFQNVGKAAATRKIAASGDDGDDGVSDIKPHPDQAAEPAT
jgi:hypothetical protein